MSKARELLTSRKFHVLVTTLIGLFFAHRSGEVPTDEAVMAAVAAASAWVLAQGQVDSAKVRRGDQA